MNDAKPTCGYNDATPLRAPELGAAAGSVAIGALVFACGAKIRCAQDKLYAFPAGKRYAVDFSRDTTMARPEKDGRCMACLTNCPAPVKKSGYQVERAWGANDNTPTPGFLVRCKVIAHDRTDPRGTVLDELTAESQRMGLYDSQNTERTQPRRSVSND